MQTLTFKEVYPTPLGPRRGQKDHRQGTRQLDPRQGGPGKGTGTALREGTHPCAASLPPKLKWRGHRCHRSRRLQRQRGGGSGRPGCAGSLTSPLLSLLQVRRGGSAEMGTEYCYRLQELTSGTSPLPPLPPPRPKTDGQRPGIHQRIVSTSNRLLAEDGLPIPGWEQGRYSDYLFVPSLPGVRG